MLLKQTLEPIDTPLAMLSYKHKGLGNGLAILLELLHILWSLLGMSNFHFINRDSTNTHTCDRLSHSNCTSIVSEPTLSSALSNTMLVGQPGIAKLEANHKHVDWVMKFRNPS